MIRGCRYEKLLFITTIVIFAITLTACGSKSTKDLKDFEHQYKDVKQKQENVEEVIDKIHLKELDNLSKTDTTDKNKKFIALQKDINNYLIPEFKNIRNLHNNYRQKQMMLKTPRNLFRKCEIKRIFNQRFKIICRFM